MNRPERIRSEPIDGLLLLNKPAGLTSNQALQKVRRMLRAKKAGHTGSLDPDATGMLPLCFGEATKVCAYLLDANKSYRVTARLGTATDTGDASGRQIAEAPVPALSAKDWESILQRFLGESMQVPPMYSALKKDGRRLYELARRGEVVEREARPIRIDAIELLELAGNRLVFRVGCSKGTYVRTLVEDIAREAGTVAHTARLHRETVGHFRSEDMLDMAQAEEMAAEGTAGLREHLLPPDAALTSFPKVDLDRDAAGRFCGGQPVSPKTGKPSGLARVYGPADEFLGVGEFTGAGKLAPRRIFKNRGRTEVSGL